MTTMKVYTHEVELFARGLYLQGCDEGAIVKLVKEQFPNARCNADTVRNWATEGNWEQAKRDVGFAVLAAQKDEAIRITQRHSELYDRMINVGEAALTGENALRPRSAAEAGSLIDTGVKGQRLALREIVSLNFVKAVFEIVMSEVKDEATRRNIALRFRELAGVRQDGQELRNTATAVDSPESSDIAPE